MSQKFRVLIDRYRNDPIFRFGSPSMDRFLLKESGTPHFIPVKYLRHKPEGLSFGAMSELPSAKILIPGHVLRLSNDKTVAFMGPHPFNFCHQIKGRKDFNGLNEAEKDFIKALDDSSSDETVSFTLFQSWTTLPCTMHVIVNRFVEGEYGREFNELLDQTWKCWRFQQYVPIRIRFEYLHMLEIACDAKRAFLFSYSIEMVDGFHHEFVSTTFLTDIYGWEAKFMFHLARRVKLFLSQHHLEFYRSTGYFSAMEDYDYVKTDEDDITVPTSDDEDDVYESLNNQMSQHHI